MRPTWPSQKGSRGDPRDRVEAVASLLAVGIEDALGAVAAAHVLDHDHVARARGAHREVVLAPLGLLAVRACGRGGRESAPGASGRSTSARSTTPSRMRRLDVAVDADGCGGEPRSGRAPGSAASGRARVVDSCARPGILARASGAGIESATHAASRARRTPDRRRARARPRRPRPHPAGPAAVEPEHDRGGFARGRVLLAGGRSQLRLQPLGVAARRDRARHLERGPDQLDRHRERAAGLGRRSRR